MTKLSKEFFENNEVLFVGYSNKNQAFCNMIFQAFSNNGIKVYPINKNEGNYDVKVYRSISDLPKIPKTAFILLNRDNTKKIIGELANCGIKRIEFQNSKNVDSAILEDCAKRGIETLVACPMMKFGKGIHKVHGFFAGVK